MVSRASELVELFRGADEPWLTGLIRARPDLARPAPSSLTALATRAATTTSVSRAVGGLTTPQLSVLEAVVVLGGGAPVPRPRLAAAADTDVTEPLAHLLASALLVPVDDQLAPAPAVVQVVGPHPLRLGPTLASLGGGYEGRPSTPSALAAVMESAPAEARALLETMTWNSPVGALGTKVPPAAAWLLEHRVLHKLAPTEVVLPREVALAARGGTLLRGLELSAPVPDAPVRGVETVVSEMVTATDDVVRHVASTLTAWRDNPPRALRAGGVSARDIRGLADHLGTDVPTATFAADLAASAGLLGHASGVADVRSWAPTPQAQHWLDLATASRWAELGRAWIQSRRVPWLAGTHTERGVLRPALDPDLHRPWARRLRRRVLLALREWPEGAAPGADQLREHLGWHTPRSIPPATVVDAVRCEAATLGLTGAGALTPLGRALLDEEDVDALAALLNGLTPEPVGHVIMQSDLSGIVPGRPSPMLAEVLDASADVESRGVATTVRFTEASVNRALEGGWTAAELLQRLRAVARTGVPQPLEYLVSDVARRQRRFRVMPSGSVIVCDDEAAALTLIGDRALSPLGLTAIAPTVLVTQVHAAAAHELMRERGAIVTLQDAGGLIVDLTPRRPQAVLPVTWQGPPTEGPVDAVAAVRAMRAGEASTVAALAHGTGADTDLLDVLTAAVAAGEPVRLVVADGAGATTERVVRLLSVEGGRVRGLDSAREAEITVATHRVVAVRPQPQAAVRSTRLSLTRAPISSTDRS